MGCRRVWMPLANSPPGIALAPRRQWGLPPGRSIGFSMQWRAARLPLVRRPDREGIADPVTAPDALQSFWEEAAKLPRGAATYIGAGHSALCAGALRIRFCAGHGGVS